MQDMRTEMLLTMAKCGVPVEQHHHEVATGGQNELGFRFAPLIEAADHLMTYKYVIKNVAKKYGKTATFMPKPLFNDNGSGMHAHHSIWKDGQPLFWGDGYANLSEIALHYIGGILKHAPALLAITNHTLKEKKTRKKRLKKSKKTGKKPKKVKPIWKLKELDYGRFGEINNNLDVSPDGEKIVYPKYGYGKNQSLGYDIYVFDLLTKKKTVLIKSKSCAFCTDVP